MVQMKKLKPLAENMRNLSKGCLNCGTVDMKAKMSRKLIQSFGGEYILKDNKMFYYPNQCDLSRESWKKQKTLMWIELQARKSSRHDWRLVCDMPLHKEVYQRQGKNNWVLVEKGLGFA